MIRIDRGAEPRGLKIAARKRLGVAAQAFNLHGAASKELNATLIAYGTPATKEALFLAQQKKCAWCERRTDFSSAPVEHYRPKDGAWRNLPDEPRLVDAGHYWWLTWTWSNLLFSCVRCNDQGHKANYFPLRPTTVCAAAPVAPLVLPTAAPLSDVSAEQPLLLDPAGSGEPLDHIEWRPANRTFDRRDWTWTPMGLTEEGRATIAILKLGELADRAQGHVNEKLLPSIEEVEQHLTFRRIKEARRRWERLLEDSLAPSADWSGFTWHALGYLVPPSYRAQHGLAELRKPGALKPVNAQGA